MPHHRAEKLMSCPLPPLNSNVSYSCSNRYPDCTNDYRFQFSSLYYILEQIALCPSDGRLFDSSVPSLTENACVQLAGSTSFTLYPGADIWSRLTTWKFPLLQLVAAFPRPPLSQKAQWFTIIHLLGNPISTIRSLLLKFASCQERAEYWHEKFNTEFANVFQLDRRGLFTDKKLTWIQMALIVDSCDEWGRDKGKDMQDFLTQHLRLLLHNEQFAVDGENERGQSNTIKFLRVCRTTANALAADRSTKFFPIVVAQAFFIGTIGIAFGRTITGSSGPTPATYINIEAHSVAISALYFWIIPAVIFSSIIGVSQTESAIPRTLHRLKVGIEAEFPQWNERLPVQFLSDLHNVEDPRTKMRECNGGIYSWQPRATRITIKDELQRSMQPLHRPTRFASVQGIRYFISYFTALQPGSLMFTFCTFLACLVAALSISAAVPPVGFGCRCIGEVAICLPWLLTALLDNVNVSETNFTRFRIIFALEVLSTLATLGGVMVVQLGVFNRCWCYTHVIGRITGVALPEIHSVAGTLARSISSVYPEIAFGCIAVELLVVPIFVFRQYGSALLVFLQRDDNKSIWAWMPSLEKEIRFIRSLPKQVLQRLGRILKVSSESALQSSYPPHTSGQESAQGLLDLSRAASRGEGESSITSDRPGEPGAPDFEPVNLETHTTPIQTSEPTLRKRLSIQSIV